MDVNLEIMRFKMELLKKMPFYGDIIMRIPFESNSSIPTAQTNGKSIEYNPSFLMSKSEANRNYIIMHEIFHILLRHCWRGNKNNPRIWNTAADMIVNDMLDKLKNDMRLLNIPFERPADAVTGPVNPTDTLENLYAQLLQINSHSGKNPKKVIVPTRRAGSSAEFPTPQDIVPGNNSGPESGDEMLPAEIFLKQIIQDSALKNRSDTQSYFIPNEIFGITKSKIIKWQTLLRGYLVEEISDDVSYTTPERKYIHMDLILPGHSLSESKIEEIWAFVDSSGSISHNELEQFLTQLYRISKEFKCIINICYWDTSVTDVYKKLTKEEDILKSVPHHSGGTDIN
ncbi:MAG: hypothetical protein IKH13_06420, partial [Clostridia bacterium]|nr:hypothetical protein [Clostridia bacterium]